MPYLLPRAFIDNELIFILAFGDLSQQEIHTVLGEGIVSARRVSEDVLEIRTKSSTETFKHLAGVHKVAIPITPPIDSPLDGAKDIARFIEGLEDDFNFSVSCYVPGLDEPRYESIIADMLSIVRDAGFRKANLVRSRGGSEVHAKVIVSRHTVDFVVIRDGAGLRIGVTVFVPDTVQFRARSNERPVVSSQISISSRLARVLLNLSGVKKGETLLDPFCGSGTILSEALLAGVNCVGIDRNQVSIENTRRNLQWISSTGRGEIGTYSLRVGDATRLESVLGGEPLVDAVVTEPILLPRIDYTPHLDKARRMIRNSSRLYSDSLYSIAGALRSGGRIVLVAPSLRTSERRDVSMTIDNLDGIGLRPFNPPASPLAYPIRIGHENTKWVSRLIYVFERM